MGKLTKYAFQVVLVSIVVWILTVFIFTNEIVFSEPEDTGSDSAVTIPVDAEYQDGTYTGSAKGHNDTLIVDVTVAAGKITDVQVVEHAETAGIADPALESVPAAIVAANSTDVDIVSGASVTSKAIMSAVTSALASSAGVTEEAPEEEAEEEVSEESSEVALAPSTEGDLKDGTYTAEVDGHNDKLAVEVTVKDGVISDVVVTDHKETAGISDPALKDIPAAIVEANSTDVEVVSGASVSSKAIIEAVNQALESAK